MRRIAILNQKGGVGKTTTTVNIAAALAKMKKRVLVIDIDPQANLSVHLNVDITSANRTIYEVLTGACTLSEAIRPLPDEGFDIVSSNIDLAGAEIELVNQMGREIILRDAVEELVETSADYDFLFIDCPPSLGLLSINALTSVRELFIPLQVQFFALQGISKLMDIIQLVRKRLNPELELTGIIPVMFDQRTRLSRQVLQEIKSFFRKTVTRATVRFNVRLAEAPSHGKSIFRYAPTSFGAEDYMKLAREINRMKRETRAFALPKSTVTRTPAKPAPPAMPERLIEMEELLHETSVSPEPEGEQPVETEQLTDEIIETSVVNSEVSVPDQPTDHAEKNQEKPVKVPAEPDQV